MDAFESPLWDLTTAAAWALTRDKDAVQMAADPDNEEALLDVRAAHLARWWEVNERLWKESGWPKPDDPLEARVTYLSDNDARAEGDLGDKIGQVLKIISEPAVPKPIVALSFAEVKAFQQALKQIRSSEAEFLEQLTRETELIEQLRRSEAEFLEQLRRSEKEARVERLRRLEEEGRIRLSYPFPIERYLTSLFQAGRLTALVYVPGDAAAHAIQAADWAFLEIDGGDQERLFVQRSGERVKAFGEVRVVRHEVLNVFPPIEDSVAGLDEEAPVSTPPPPAPKGHGKKAAAIAWARQRYPSGRPPGQKNPELQQKFKNDGGVPMHRNTFAEAMNDAWRE
jgi:hypothetical protein